MKFVYPDIARVFDTRDNGINCIVIENQQLFYTLCTDIYKQSQGFDGKATLSIDDKPVEICKNAEFVSQFVPFEINRKSLISKLGQVAEKIAISPELYESTMQELGNIERYLIEITGNLHGNVTYDKPSIALLIKAMGLHFEDDYSSLGEKIIDYMELVRGYDKDKLFIFVNLRSYISDEECVLFFDTIQRQLFNVIMIENIEHLLLQSEVRYIIDKDLCEIT